MRGIEVENKFCYLPRKGIYNIIIYNIYNIYNIGFTLHHGKTLDFIGFFENFT